MTTSSEIFGVTTVDETFNGCPVDDAKYCGDVIKSYGTTPCRELSIGPE